LNIRELHKDDFDIFCQFMSKFDDSLNRLLCFSPDKKEWLRHTFDDPDFDQELFLGIFENNLLIGVVLGIVRAWKAPQKGFIKFIFAEHSSEESRILSKLLREIQKRLSDKNISEIHFGSSSPYYLFPGLPAENKKLYNILISLSWQDVSERINRVIDMRNLRISQSDLTNMLYRTNCANLATNSSEIEEEVTYSISIATEDDKDDLTEFIENEFSQSWAKECQKTFSPHHNAFSSIIRNADNKIIGFAALNASNPNWFGPMGVEMSLRGKGLGKLLVLYTILYAKKQLSQTESLLLPWINDNNKFYCTILGEMQKDSYRKMLFSCK